MHLTETQKRLMRVMQDGEFHHYTELMECLNDELAQLGALKWHVMKIRKYVRPKGEEIVCEQGKGRKGYRWIKHLKGKTDYESSTSKEAKQEPAGKQDVKQEK